ncbi:MAG: hypothetical protein C4288_09855 [Leptolyngbya sp. ERB_1_1]
MTLSLNGLKPLRIVAYPDWKTKFSTIQKAANVPDTAQRVYQGKQWIVQDLFVDLSEVDAQLIAQQHTLPESVEIYADVVRIPANYVGLFNGVSVIIAARRIEMLGVADLILDYRQSDRASLTLYAQEIAGKINITSLIDDAQPKATFELNSFAAGAIGFEVTYDRAILYDRFLQAVDPAMLLEGSDFTLLLGAVFQYATLLLETDVQTAIAQLSWLKTATAGVETQADLFLQSSALLATLQAAGNTTFVPVLSRDLYEKQSTKFISAAAAYEQQYQRFSDKVQAIQDRKQAAQLMLDYYKDTTDFESKLIEQCQNNLESAKESTDAASAKLHSQQNIVEQAQVTFQSGLKQWKYDQQLKASVEIISGIVELGAGIALMFVGDEAAIAGAVTALAKIGTKGAQLAEIIEKIAKLTQKMLEIYSVAQKIAEASASIAESQHLTEQMQEINQANLSSADGEDLSATVFWQKLQLEAKNALQVAIDNHIPGASEYQLQLDILVVYGQALAANQQSVIQLSQELVRLTLQQQVSSKQQQRLTDYVSQISASIPPTVEMMQLFYQRYLNIKRSLFISLYNYNRAYRYWALRTSRFQPSIVQSVAEQKAYLANIQQDYAAALERFSPRVPQTLQGAMKVITDASILAALQSDRTASWAINLDDQGFRGVDRVRVDTIRVWLQGAKSAKNHPCYIVITNTGHYLDRYQSTSYSFSSMPIEREFKYMIPTDWKQWRESGWNGRADKYVEIEGKVADEFRYAYFEPTVFSSWTIELPQSENPDLDLSELSAIVIEFGGNVIASPQRSTVLGAQLL